MDLSINQVSFGKRIPGNPRRLTGRIKDPRNLAINVMKNAKSYTTQDGKRISIQKLASDLKGLSLKHIDINV